MSAAQGIASAVRDLDDARARLASRTDEEITGSLALVFEHWRDAGSTCRRELEAKLPAATGFSPEAVRAGLARGFEPWTGEAFKRAVDDELGPIPDSGVRSEQGHERTAVVLAGSIPMPSLLSIVLPLVLRSPVLCKPASRDLLTANLVADSIRAVDSRLGDCVAIVPFEKEDKEASRAFFDSPCVVATGSTETIAEVESQLSSDQARVLYGHRISIGAIDLDALATSDYEATTVQLAIDVALWDQLGCLSPTVFYLVGGDDIGASAFAATLANALQDREAEWPRGMIDVETAAMIARERSDAEMRAALGKSTRVLASEGTQWTVVLEHDATLRPAPLHRFVRLARVRDRTELMNAIAPLKSVLAGVTIAGFQDSAALSHDLLELGASRVCEPGELQAPPIDWPRDNQPLLRGMIARVKGTG